MAGNVSSEAKQEVLQELRDNGRASFVHIASAVGLTRHQVASVVQSALARDEIRLKVSVRPDVLGIERFAYLQIAVSGPAQPVREALTEMPETAFVADVTGHFSLDAEIRVGPYPSLRNTIDRVLQLPGVTGVRSSIYEAIISNRFSPLQTSTTPFALDSVDRSIISFLQNDVRATYREIGDATRLSPSGARLRVERLIASGIIKPVGIPVRTGNPTAPTLGVGIQAGVPVEELSPQLTALDPEFLAIATGAYDFIATISAPSAGELADTVEKLRCLPGVSNVDSWANLRIVKEQYGESDAL